MHLSPGVGKVAFSIGWLMPRKEGDPAVQTIVFGSGRSVVRLARVVRVHEVVSSNLTAPTNFSPGIEVGAKQGFEQLAMVWDFQVKQLVDDDVLPEFRGLREQIAAE